MPRFDLTDSALKDALKEALLEVLVEQPQLLQDIVEDALQDMALAEAMRDSESHDRKLGRTFVFEQTKGEA